MTRRRASGRSRRKRKKNTKKPIIPAPVSGDWVFSSAFARPRHVEDLSRSSDLLDLSAVKSLVHTTGATGHRRRGRDSEGLRIMREIKHRLGLDTKRPEWARNRRRSRNQKDEIDIAKKMANDMHMSLDELNRFEHLEDNIEGDEKELERECKEAFAKFDVDSSGGIDKDEIEAVLRYVGEKLSEKDIARIRNMADADGDGVVSYEEFLNVLKARRRILALTQSMIVHRQTKDTTKTRSADVGRRKRRRAAPPLPALRIPGDIQSRRNMRSINTFLPRPTPKCLATTSGNWTSASALRRELQASKQAIEAVDAQMKRNVEWVQANCPVTNIRAQLFCKRWGAEKLERIVNRVLHAHMRRALLHWYDRVQFERCEEKAAQFLKLRGSRLLMNIVKNHEHGRVMKSWSIWCDEIRRQIFEEQTEAAIAIQAVVRSFLTRRRLWNARIARAATVIQKHYRGRLGAKLSARRREEILVHGAAVEIGRFFRGHQARRRVENMRQQRRELGAAHVLQRSWRGTMGRRRVAALRDERQKQRSATAVQCAWRSRHARVEVEKRRLARRQQRGATVIQSVFRSRVDRVRVKAMLEERRKDRAALVLQCAHRSRAAQRRVNLARELREQRKRAATLIQSHARASLVRLQIARRLARESLETSSAVAIQSAFRCRRARLERDTRRSARDAKRNEAARRIQAAHRGLHARVEVGRMRVEKNRRRRASIALQSRFRGHRQRLTNHRRAEERQRRLKAARRIQAWFRGCTGRYAAHVYMSAERTRRESVHAQAAKDALDRRKRADEELAAIRLQTAARGHLSRMSVGNLRQRRRREREARDAEKRRIEREIAAVKLQSVARKRQARRRLEARRKEIEDDNALDGLKRSKAKELAALELQSGLTGLLADRIAEERERKLREELETEKLLARAALERHAAQQIQAVWRGRKDRIACAALFREHRERVAKDSRRIAEEARRMKMELLRQAEERARKEQEKVEHEKRSHAALQIQCVFRQSESRKALREKRQEIIEQQKRTKAMGESALKVQCAFRGHRARKLHADRKKDHEEELKRLREERAANEEIERLKRKQRRELAALKVQSAMRAKWARRDAAEKLRRQIAARREFERREREANAAKTIQALYRARRDRKMIKVMKRRVREQKRAMIDAAAEAAAKREEHEANDDAAGEWIEYWDETHQAPYWFNTVTQEARWENPSRFDAGYESSYTAGTATDYDTDNWTDPTNEGYDYGGNGSYQQQITAYGGNAYAGGGSNSGYYGGGGGSAGDYGYANPQSQQQQSEWTEGVDPSSGQKYYYNTRTGETQWEGSLGAGAW